MGVSSNGTIDMSNSGGDTQVVADIDGSQLLAYASGLILEDADDLAVIRNITEDSVLPCPIGKPSLIEILYTFLCTSLTRSAH